MLQWVFSGLARGLMWDFYISVLTVQKQLQKIENLGVVVSKK